MLALEDNDRRMQARLRTVLDGKSTIVPKGGTGWELVQPPGIERLNYVTQWDRIGQGGIERLDAHLTGRPQTRLVVIDTLARFRADDPGRKSAYAYDYDVGAQLKPLSDKHKVAVVLVHHTRKAASEDALDAVSGTQGLSGSVDAIMLLKRGRGAADGEMFVTGRDIEGDENTALRFDKESCAWSSLGSVEDVRRSAARRGVLDYLAEQGPLKPKDIAEGVGQKGPTVRKLLKAMLADGEVIVDDAGAYTVAKAA